MGGRVYEGKKLCVAWAGWAPPLPLELTGPVVAGAALAVFEFAGSLLTSDMLC